MSNVIVDVVMCYPDTPLGITALPASAARSVGQCWECELLAPTGESLPGHHLQPKEADLPRPRLCSLHGGSPLPRLVDIEVKMGMGLIVWSLLYGDGDDRGIVEGHSRSRASYWIGQSLAGSCLPVHLLFLFRAASFTCLQTLHGGVGDGPPTRWQWTGH